LRNIGVIMVVIAKRTINEFKLALYDTKNPQGNSEEKKEGSDTK